ncbi:MAG: hypothetical protein Q9195_005450 [Heterodermia aff. obscurata]
MLGVDRLAGPNRPLPSVSDIDATSFPSEQDLVKEIVQGLKFAGGCVVRKFVDKEDIKKMEQDFAPHFAMAKPLVGKKVFGKLSIPQRKFLELTTSSQSETYALKIVGNPVWQAVGRHFLTSKLRYDWVGTKEEHSVSDPQLNRTSVLHTGPGARAQSLHRDDSIFHVYNPAVSEHHLGRDYGVGMFVAGSRSTRHNGATRFIPGSHLWDYAEPPVEKQSYFAELEPGDAFIMLSGCFHAASANTTANEERRLYVTFMCRGWCRQEENQYMANDSEKVKSLPMELQRFMGYYLSRPFLGWVDMNDPILALHPQLQGVNGF